MNPNQYQIGGNHYMRRNIQHWDLAMDLRLDYFQGVITKYLDRYEDKHEEPTEDLQKALHYLKKYHTSPFKIIYPAYTEEQYLLIGDYLDQFPNGLRTDAIRAIIYQRLPQAKRAIEQLLEKENGSRNDIQKE